MLKSAILIPGTPQNHYMQLFKIYSCCLFITVLYLYDLIVF